MRGVPHDAAGTHADVRAVVPEGLSISVDEMRALVLRAAATPDGGRWQVVLIEDADRLTEGRQRAAQGDRGAAGPDGVPALRAVHAPRRHLGDHPVALPDRAAAHAAGRRPWPRCSSRRDGIDPDMAAWVAAASQGHVGRARRLARDPDARTRRDAVLAIPRADRARRLLRRGRPH